MYKDIIKTVVPAVMLLLVFSVVGIFASSEVSNDTSAIGTNTNITTTDTADYVYYYDNKPLETQQNGITKEEVETIFNTKWRTFMKREFKDNVNIVAKELLNMRNNCITKHDKYWYYDYGVNDCRNCLREDCERNDVCVAQCGEILRVKALEEESASNRNLAIISLTLIGILFVVVVVVFSMSASKFYRLSKKYETVKPVRNVQPTKADADEAAEKLVKVICQTDSGTGSAVTIAKET
ncbi:uncharacterized protein LOC120348616 [Styela clava]